MDQLLVRFSPKKNLQEVPLTTKDRIIFGGFIIVKEFIDQIFFWLPFYEYFGPVFVTLMVHPRVQGARKVYNMFVKPFFTELSAVESGKIKLDELDEHEKLVFQAVLKALEVVRAILSRGLCQKVYEKVYPVATRCIDICKFFFFQSFFLYDLMYSICYHSFFYIVFLKDHVLERVKRRGSSGGDENSADEETKKDD